jgi:hypothetical protein
MNIFCYTTTTPDVSPTPGVFYINLFIIMDSQISVQYELCDLFSGKNFITDSREEATAYFENGWMVYENHISRFKPSMFTTTTTSVVILWNNNPELKEI